MGDREHRLRIVSFDTCSVEKLIHETNFDARAGGGVIVVHDRRQRSAIVAGGGREQRLMGTQRAGPYCFTSGRQLCVRNETHVPGRVTVTVPTDARLQWCADNADLCSTWYSDESGKRYEIYTLCIDVPPKTEFAVCNALGSLRSVCCLVTRLSEHLQKTPKEVMRVTFPVRRSDGQPCYCVQGWGGVLTHHGVEFHHAIDISCPEGTDIVAVADGVVVSVIDSNKRCGAHVDHLCEGYNEVLVSHPTGLESLYLHIAQGSARVQVGDVVKAGQVVASSGLTGFAPWPHLHFQMNRGRFAEVRRPEDYPSVGVAFEAEGGGDPFVPVAGYWYTPSGRCPPPIEEKRRRSQVVEVDCGGCGCAASMRRVDRKSD
eukprot:TRINITY_DN17300_c0_g2_i1.p1 TRINITY_DN17300_c0_g2~~TRINITY_DN17300_c0_g2_i1.p1  ORF type:complete len:373 (+),score=5.97 TRINITY_DN17300_c0_g2_i1:69-1187(+)